MRIINSALLFIVLANPTFAQQSDQPHEAFWNQLKSLCGNAYTAEVMAAPENDSFRGQVLVMHVRSCTDDVIKVPFFVGDDKSRTWVFSKSGNQLTLKHDHRHEDGSEDEVTQYGGTSPNTGLSNIQFFPADVQTAELIPAAATNVWWIELEEEFFTYNLRRLGTDRYFSIKFDLTQTVETPDAPWGWVD
jgi:hypothetical protein